MSTEQDQTWSAVAHLVNDLDPVPAGLVARVLEAVDAELARSGRWPRPERRAA